MQKKRKNRDRDGLYRRKDSPYWWASYTNAGGRRTRRSTGTADRREAEAILAKWRVEAHRGRHWDEQPERTFDELMLAYIQETEPGGQWFRPAAKRLYRTFSGRTLNNLRPQDIRAYVRERKQEGRAASTINKEIGLLSAAINYARREWGWEIDNPATGCRQREPEGRVRWITRKDAAALIEAASADTRAKHLPDFIRLAVNTGCRKGELLGMEWKRIDLQAGIIHLEAEHTKTGRRRAVPMNKEARAAIISRARFRAQHCPASPWLFCRKDGSRIADVKRSFATACKRADIEDFRIHDLRHTCAAWLVTAGVPLAEVRDLLGHRSIQMTERYAHLSPENVRAAVARLDDDSHDLVTLEKQEEEKTA
ncbi:MAG TPA: site-specific integrase [Bacteroidetes bacterium]|nr:site-specific integrase [Bacteroidota bacterium]